MTFLPWGVIRCLSGGWRRRSPLELAVTLSLADVYRAPTVSAIAALIDERAGHGYRGARREAGFAAADAVQAAGPPGSAGTGRYRCRCSSSGCGFSSSWRRATWPTPFQATVSLHGEVDTGVLRAALDEIVRRHEILRTAFVTVDGVAMQQLVAGVTAPLRVLDVPAEQAEEVIAAELRKPFDLTRPPLARWVLLRHGDGENTLVYAEHHIVHDGWSQGVLLSELGVLYQAFAAGEPSPLPEPAAQYADYALWQREWMQGEVLKAHADHGAAMLAGAPHVLELPADHPRPPVMSFRGAAPRIEVPAELSRALRSFSQQHRVSLFATMYAGFAALLYRYTGQEDMLVGTGAANRSLPELQQMLGMIVNTLVLRTRVSRPDVVRGPARPGAADRRRRAGLARYPGGRRHRRDRPGPRPLPDPAVPGHLHLPRLGRARPGLRRAHRRCHRARERRGHVRPHRDGGAAGRAAAWPRAPPRG